jgi:GT2 family glycosyltransferase
MASSSHRPHVTVVVPVHNCAATIEDCLGALVAQTYPRELTEILVVDNDSTDETPVLAASFPVTLLAERDVRTSYAARNRGAAAASGEIVAFTDGDCIAAPDWLRRLAGAFDDPAVAAVAGTVDDAPPGSLCEEFTARIQPFARPQRAGLTTLLTANVAIRRSALERLGGFDERLPTGGDVDFGWRLQGAGMRLIDEPRARVVHRHRATFTQVFEQFRRYGLSEILLATIHRGSGAAMPPQRQLWRMLSQTRAIASYVLGLIVRSVLSPIRGGDRRYLLWPVFLLVVESGSLTGKVEGLLVTRGWRRQPTLGDFTRRAAPPAADPAGRHRPVRSGGAASGA